MPFVTAVQELVLLLLVGVSSTLLAYIVDKSVNVLSDARMHASPDDDPGMKKLKYTFSFFLHETKLFLLFTHICLF